MLIELLRTNKSILTHFCHLLLFLFIFIWIFSLYGFFPLATLPGFQSLWNETEVNIAWGPWGTDPHLIQSPPGKLESNSLGRISLLSLFPMVLNHDWRNCAFPQQSKDACRDAYNVSYVRFTDCRKWQRWVSKTPSAKLREAGKHRRERSETLTELQYGNVYTCSKPCNRNPALHNQWLSGSLM